MFHDSGLNASEASENPAISGSAAEEYTLPARNAEGGGST